jgi:hypothetical protein
MLQSRRQNRSMNYRATRQVSSKVLGMHRPIALINSPIFNGFDKNSFAPKFIQRSR